MTKTMSAGDSQAPAEDDRPRSVTALDVAEIAQAHYMLARSTDGTVVAYPRDAKAARVAREVRSLRPHLTRLLMAEGRTASRDVMTAALDVLEAIAEDSPEERVYLRAAEVGAAIHLDLAQRDERSTFVEVSRYGWEVRDPFAEDDPTSARPLFRRTAPTKPLPVPERDEPGQDARADFRDLLGLDEEDPRWRLIWGWLVLSVFESVPRPILWAVGPQGSGKSTRARMILSVLEPCEALGRPPESERDDSTSARGRYLPSWDNVSNVGAKTSDWLCRLVTGVEIDRRALYTDDNVRTTVLRRSGVATSIVVPYGLRPDALERLILVHFERVSERDRMPESVLWQRFHALHPRLLGAVLDDVAGVLAHRAAAREEAISLPRMADYAVLLAALDRHAEWSDLDGFASAYADAVSTSLAASAEEDPLVAGLRRHVALNGNRWEGSVTSLLTVLETYKPDDPRSPWPHSPESLGRMLTTASETLRALGLTATKRRGKAGVTWTLTLEPAEG